MKLLGSDTSPYVRKVRLAAEATGVADQIELTAVTTTPTAEDPAAAEANPLAKIPALVLDDGLTLFDSRVIVEYLDAIGQARLLPARGDPERWRTLKIQATADGLLDAALLLRYETFLRPAALRWDEWCAGQRRKIERAADALETEAGRIAGGAPLNAIVAACALGYLDFRFPDLDWRAGRPALAAFFADYARRPEMVRTAPPA